MPAIVLSLVLLQSCVKPPPESAAGTGKPYLVNGEWYQPAARKAGHKERGLASWYGAEHHGKPTASGERFDMNALTAAHRTLPMQTMVKVTNQETGRSTVVRINDRGPFIKGRIIDLSKAAAEAIDLVRMGVARVELEVMEHECRTGTDTREVPADAYFVQIGAFGDRRNAERLVARLEPRWNLTILTAGDVHRVQVGPFNSLKHAGKALQQLEDEGYHGAFVIARSMP
ncbi:septal ring lytic transglycosylase RlpA family protein [bacterium]|nr:septal ring lytic transglycosylase RlpA family protein [candidate division CSSED10-310 bacterium]